jgi:Protein of unknown function (DUF1045)
MGASTAEPRYAIYFVPSAESDLYRFGASVLGYDIYAGNDIPFIRNAGPDWPEKVRDPRTYGFHATLKPPFRLAGGASISDLETSLQVFVKSRNRIDVGPMEVRPLGRFIALVPVGRCPELEELAGACVQHFDHFRAPMDEQERARRLTAPLTESQMINLDRWGYPYVFDEFQFHMTLTGALVDHDRKAALQFVRAEFASRLAAHRLVLGQLVIAHQSDKAFRVVRWVALGK